MQVTKIAQKGFCQFVQLLSDIWVRYTYAEDKQKSALSYLRSATYCSCEAQQLAAGRKADCSRICLRDDDSEGIT